MASSAPKCHVLDFKYDDRSGCDLLVLVNGVRFLIMVEERALLGKDENDSSLRNEYMRLLDSVRGVKSGREAATEEAQSIPDPETAEQTRADLSDEFQLINDGHDSALGSSPTATAEADDIDETDSAADLNEQSEDDKREHAVKQKHRGRGEADEAQTTQQKTEDEDARDPEATLQNWILSSFGSPFQRFAPPAAQQEKQSLHQWYHSKTHFFTLESQEGTLVPIELKYQPEYKTRVEYLVPRMKLPKHLRNLQVTWTHSKDIVVLSESDQPQPLRPARVEIDGEVRFLKVVDPEQNAPAMRELGILTKIQRLGLQEQINVPQIVGLVPFEDSKTEIMGFLMNEIKGARPLTTLFDDNIPDEKRREWAEQSEMIVGLLHEHNIVWGDAKADNFLVDEDDRLWIIDFGGSYTEGWVDPEWNETEEGDEMGVEKIVNALEDPKSNTYEPGVDTQEGLDDSSRYGPDESRSCKKRKARSASDGDDNDIKRRK